MIISSVRLPPSHFQMNVTNLVIKKEIIRVYTGVNIG